MTRTIESALQDLQSGTVTSVELVTEAIDRADVLDGTLGVFMARYNESALAAAQASDDARARGEKLGPLAGIPIGIKDIITTKEGPTTCQSLVFDSSSFSGDATVVARLRAAGAIIVGKSTTMEFAIGTPDFSKPFPIPRNPWNTDRWTGGSSSGTGGGVASEMFLGGLGTDTGGSIRIPAANCGITGLKATFGRVPKDGCAPLGFSLDHIGPMARSAYDCAVMLNVMAGHGPDDHAVADEPVTDYTAGLTGDLTGMRIGIDRLERKYTDLSAKAELAASFDALEGVLTARGATVVPVTLPFHDEVSTASLILMITEAFAYHRNDLRDQWDNYSRGLRDCIAMAPFYSAADVIQAQRIRRVGVKAIAALLKEVDVIVSPTTTAGALDFDQVYNMWDGPATVNLTGYWNGTGNPSMSVPFGYTDAGLPLGVEITGAAFDEATVLKVGHAFQRSTDYHLRQAPALTAELQPAE
jgi:aspartyl-tRNA(Asn)/glutamyl-tRNA(Gln) amidotransferase subunit A